MLAYAKRYQSLGWWVLPLTPGTKQPFSRLVPNGVHNASNDLETITRWWTAEPNAGIGIAVKPSGLVVIDIDPRNGGFETMERLESLHGPLTSDVLALTGGGGEHRVFISQLVEGLPGKLGPGVDVKADGYICVEPSIHPNGNKYVWEGSSDPLEGCVPSSLPGWVRDLARPQSTSPVFIAATRFIDDKQVEDIRCALECLPSDDYHQWVNFGNALVQLGQIGFTLWDNWSRKSPKYDPRAVTSKWRSFKPGSYQLESIFFAAQNIGWVNPASIPSTAPVAVPVSTVAIAKQVQLSQPSMDLLAPPGILGVVTEWVNATARKPQPMFAVQAAIAFCATVMGRRFVTDQRNWPSLYLLNIGLSSSGKEYAKTAVESLLEACNLSHLIGPASYTSNSGVLSALHNQPSHLTVIDEFGKELEQASVKGNSRAQGMLKSLMEVWGRCDGTLRPQGFSTFGMSEQDVKKMAERSVRNPALTMLAMTTPGTFFESIGSAAARDGFLNRFLIVESDTGRQVGSGARAAAVPDAIVQWAENTLQASSLGLVDAAVSPGTVPCAVEVKMSDEALAMFKQFDAQCVDLMNQYEFHGLAEMFGRTNEMAMRLSLIAAIGASKQAVDGHSAAWAIEYVRHHALRTVERLKSSVADSPFEASKKQVLGLLVKHCAKGMTVAEISRSSLRFRGMTQRQQVELLNSLEFLGQAKFVEFKSPSGRGKTRKVWVAVDDESIDVDETMCIPLDAVAGENNE